MALQDGIHAPAGPGSPAAPRNRWLPRVVTVFFLGLSVLGCWPAWATFEPLVRYRRTTATMVSAEVVSKWVVTSNKRGTHQHIAYAPEVLYQFTVDGQTYFGSRYNPTEKYGQRSGAEWSVRRLQPGAQVPAWYDPSDPSRSVLRRNPDLRMLMWVILPFLIGRIVLFFMHLAQQPSAGTLRQRRAA